MSVLPLFPLHSVLFPGTTMALHIFEARYRALLKRCRGSGEGFGVALIRAGDEVGGPATPFSVGTEAVLVAVEDLPDGRADVLIEGRRRFRITRLLPAKPYPQAEVEFLPEPAGDAREWRRTVLDLLPAPDGEPAPEDPVELSYRLGDLAVEDAGQRQELLETADAAERLKKAAVLLLRTRAPARGAG